MEEDTNSSNDVFVHDRKTGINTRVSVDSAGNEANSDSFGSISANGRFVAFQSSASNLVPGDTNSTSDVFVHDRKTGITTRVSVDSAGNDANSDSFGPSISAHGRFVAFQSLASNLVPGDTNGTADTFVHDRKTAVTRRVNVDSAGNEGNEIVNRLEVSAPSISANGRFVAFQSSASNLVPGDTNGVDDIFVHESAPNASRHNHDDNDDESVEDDDQD
jgi:archaellum component FlaF (FlaF/FlaG flagellin family)